MKADYTDITIVLDRSGSMKLIADAAIAGFNRLVDEQRAMPGDIRLSLVQFHHRVRFSFRGVPVVGVPQLTAEHYEPRGRTALLDAIGAAIDDTGGRLAAMVESERPAKVVVAILTDGQENASRAYKREAVADRVQHQRNVYSWQFLFLAANQDAILEGGSLGISPGAAKTFAATALGTKEAFTFLSRSIGGARNGRRVSTR